MKNQIKEDMKIYLTCGHPSPQFKIKYNIGNNQTETLLVCSKCIQDSAYRDGVLSSWCYNCKREHNGPYTKLAKPDKSYFLTRVLKLTG